MNIALAQKIALTGIKPTGKPHLGNYLGMIRPALELVQDYRALYFIANAHALTTTRDKETLTRSTYEVAATWLALGLDPAQSLIYRQSDIPEVFELTWVLSCFAAKGLLNRAHAYKAAVDVNEAAGRNPDDGVNHGLYTYPVLMAADILLFGTEVVPVGSDQRQHVEIARDIALAFNSAYGDVLVVPEAAIKPDVQTITGLDGRKMSKSYNNTIQLFVTDSKAPDEPKDPDTCNIFAIYQHVAPLDDVARVREQYRAGGLAYGRMKLELFERLEATFGSAREDYNDLMNHPGEIHAILQDGAEQARGIAVPIMDRVRACIGI
jgi:tryptophanyl-tRNA synthetase